MRAEASDQAAGKADLWGLFQKEPFAQLLCVACRGMDAASASGCLTDATGNTCRPAAAYTLAAA